jgi:hypothetical protein
VIGKAGRENLGFIFEAPKRPGMDYAVAIPLESVAVRVFRLGIAASPRTIGGEAQMPEGARHLFLWQFPECGRDNSRDLSRLRRKRRQQLPGFVGLRRPNSFGQRNGCLRL